MPQGSNPEGAWGDASASDAAVAASSPVQAPPELPAVRTHASPPPLRSPSQGPPPEREGTWVGSAPFRGAPMTYVMHSPPSGTPLASPRESGTTTLAADDAAEGDLEAPLLQQRTRGMHSKHQHPKPFASGGILKAIVFGLINTAAGVVSGVSHPLLHMHALHCMNRHKVPRLPPSRIRPLAPTLSHPLPPPLQPALIAFCAVVFKDPLYHPYVDPLCKLFFLASALHQVVVCLRSDVPNAVGQVQDVGLIFLSAMASSIAALCTAAGRDAASALGTSLLTMAASTALVGLGLVAVGAWMWM